jgi:transcriptional regulator with XRE-family HTH domain
MSGKIQLRLRFRKTGGDETMAEELPRIYVREWRQFAGYTQGEMAELMGMTENSFWRYETGDRGYDVEFLFAFSQIIGCRNWHDPITRPPDNPAYRGVPIPLEKYHRSRSRLIEEMQRLGVRDKRTSGEND